MKRTGMEELEAITAKTLIEGIDIAKKVHLGAVCGLPRHPHRQNTQGENP